MDEKSLTLTVMGIIVILAIVGLVLLFSAAKTGAGVYGGALKGKSYPYTRFLEHTGPVVETPGYQTTLIEPWPEDFGGATETLVNLENVPREVQKDVTYKRDPFKKTRTGIVTCNLAKFPGNVFAPIRASQQQRDSYVSMGRKCFEKMTDGTRVLDTVGSFACCTR
jgi:hypothetical protein